MEILRGMEEVVNKRVEDTYSFLKQCRSQTRKKGGGRMEKLETSIEGRDAASKY